MVSIQGDKDAEDAGDAVASGAGAREDGGSGQEEEEWEGEQEEEAEEERARLRKDLEDVMAEMQMMEGSGLKRQKSARRIDLARVMQSEELKDALARVKHLSAQLRQERKAIEELRGAKENMEAQVRGHAVKRSTLPQAAPYAIVLARQYVPDAYV